jgi:hypothetical protein
MEHDPYAPEVARCSTGHVVIKMTTLDAFELLDVLLRDRDAPALEPLVDALSTVGIFNENEEDDSE